MKKSFISVYSLLFSILSLIFSQIYAQSGKSVETHKFLDLERQLQELRSNKILPEIINFKKEIESLLLPSDFDKLNLLRTRASKLNIELIDSRIALLVAVKENNKEKIKIDRGLLTEIQKKKIDLFEELKSLLLPYSAKLKSAAEKHYLKIMPIYKESMKIRMNWYNKNKMNLNNKEKSFLKKRMKKMKEDAKHSNRRRLNIARILLYDSYRSVINMK